MTVKELKEMLATVPEKYDVLVRDEHGQEWEPGVLLADDNKWFCYIQWPKEFRIRAKLS